MQEHRFLNGPRVLFKAQFLSGVKTQTLLVTGIKYSLETHSSVFGKRSWLLKQMSSLVSLQRVARSTKGPEERRAKILVRLSDICTS